MSEVTPDVTVVVIGYNDSARLPRAIRSVQRQTLRNLEIIVVDDASTDDSADVVQALAVDDPRIRYVCLPANSGGCSAPRNEGLDLARAPWVMFCDSDDEYERHACKNLLLAAERLSADVVCGAAERVDIRTGASRRWKPELHDREVVADGLAAFPELLVDTISVNKIYRRALLIDNGIRFPEGLLFEDQLFTLEAMTAARRIAAIPQTVYRWYVDELSDEPSITQRRNEAANVDSRIEINRRIDDFLATEERAPIRAVKELKFLRHDLYLYLAVMLEVDDKTASVLMERLRPYVFTANLAPAWQVRPGLRVAIYHLLVGDLAGIRSAMRQVKWASVVGTTIVEEEGRQFWACEHLESDEAPGGFASRDWLDVTELHALDVPYSQRRFLHRLEALEIAGDRIVASGSSVDYDGSLAQSAAVELLFVIGRSRKVASVPARWVGEPGDSRSWRAEGQITSRSDRPLVEGDHGTIALATAAGSVQNVTGIRAGAELDVRGRLTLPSTEAREPSPSDVLEVRPGRNGAVGWSLLEPPAGLAPGASAGTNNSRRWWSGFKEDVAIPGLTRLARSLPADDLVLFDTSAVRSVNESVRALSEYLHVERPALAQAWVHRDRPDRVPAYARPIERLSPEHRRAAARARWLIDDGTATLGVRARPGGQVVFVHDGVPVTRTGLDDPSNLTDSDARTDIVRRGSRWTTALVPSRFAGDVVARAYGFTGEVIEVGLLRADGALEDAHEPHRAALRATLDLDLDRPVVLYAPALRVARSSPGEPLIDLNAWVSALGDRAYLVIAGDPREPIEDSTALRHAVRTLTAAERAIEVLPACDLLITDYTTLLGDAALLGVPTVLFQPDGRDYIDRAHGLYIHSPSVAPTAQSTAELIAHVQGYVADRDGWALAHAASLRSFAASHCGPTGGGSLRRAVDALWPARASGPA